jgi:hypothetical protein
VGTGEASVVDVAALRAPDASFDDSTFVMICLSQLGQDVSEALLLKMELAYTPKYVSASDVGQITYSTEWLPAGSTNINNPITSTLITGYMAYVSEDGTATIKVPSYDLPAAANGINGAPVTLVNLEVNFHIESATQVCATLGGSIPAQGVTFTPSENPCIVLPTKNGTWAPVTAADIHCP